MNPADGASTIGSRRRGRRREQVEVIHVMKVALALQLCGLAVLGMTPPDIASGAGSSVHSVSGSLFSMDEGTLPARDGGADPVRDDEPAEPCRNLVFTWPVTEGEVRRLPEREGPIVRFWDGRQWADADVYVPLDGVELSLDCVPEFGDDAPPAPDEDRDDGRDPDSTGTTA